MPPKHGKLVIYILIKTQIVVGLVVESVALMARNIVLCTSQHLGGAMTISVNQILSSREEMLNCFRL